MDKIVLFLGVSLLISSEGALLINESEAKLTGTTKELVLAQRLADVIILLASYIN